MSKLNSNHDEMLNIQRAIIKLLTSLKLDEKTVKNSKSLSYKNLPELTTEEIVSTVTERANDSDVALDNRKLIYIQLNELLKTRTIFKSKELISIVPKLTPQERYAVILNSIQKIESKDLQEGLTHRDERKNRYFFEKINEANERKVEELFISIKNNLGIRVDATVQEKVCHKLVRVSDRQVERDLEKLTEPHHLRKRKVGGVCFWSMVYNFDETNNHSHESNEINTSDALIINSLKGELEKRLPAQTFRHFSSVFELADRHIGADDSPTLLRKVHRVPDYYPLIKNNELIEPNIWNALFEAVHNEYQIKAIYQKRLAPEEEKILNPHAIILREYRYYLIATDPSLKNDEKHKNLRTYRIDRFKDVQLLKVKKRSLFYDFSPNKEKIEDYIKRAGVGFADSKNKIKIELEVTGLPLQLLQMHKISDDQDLEPFTSKRKTPQLNRKEGIDDDWATVSATVTPSLDLYSWLMSFGKDVRVLKPAFLKEKMNDRNVINYETASDCEEVIDLASFQRWCRGLDTQPHLIASLLNMEQYELEHYLSKEAETPLPAEFKIKCNLFNEFVSLFNVSFQNNAFTIKPEIESDSVALLSTPSNPRSY